MRLVVFSASSGVLYTYQDYAHTDGGNANEGEAYAVRLFHVNKLLLQASGGGAQQGLPTSTDAPSITHQGGWTTTGGNTASERGGNSATVLGAGIRRPNHAKALASFRPHSRLAVRQWHLDSEQWHLAENRDVDIILALSVPAAWDPAPAESLAMAVLDAFVHAHRPQLQALAAAATTAPPLPVSLRPALTTPAPKTFHLLSSPESTATLMTRQALKLLCKMAQEAMDTLAAHCLQPCWLFVAHVDSFMGSPPRSAGAQAATTSRQTASETNGGGSGGRGGSRPPSQKGKGKVKGFLMSVLSALRKGSSIGREASGKEGSGMRNRDAAVHLGQDPEESTGPVGLLHHLVLPSLELRGNSKHPSWDAPSITAALWQVRPPPEEVSTNRLPARAGVGGDTTSHNTTSADGSPLTFPELEDVDLTMEIQLGGPSQPVRGFSVVAIRLGHVVAVVAQQQESGEGSGGDDGDAVDVTPGGSINLFRCLLRPFLVPMSSLFHYLACWAPPDEVELQGMLMRLLPAFDCGFHVDDVAAPHENVCLIKLG